MNGWLTDGTGWFRSSSVVQPARRADRAGRAAHHKHMGGQHIRMEASVHPSIHPFIHHLMGPPGPCPRMDATYLMDAGHARLGARPPARPPGWLPAHLLPTQLTWHAPAFPPAPPGPSESKMIKQPWFAHPVRTAPLSRSPPQDSSSSSPSPPFPFLAGSRLRCRSTPLSSSLHHCLARPGTAARRTRLALARPPTSPPSSSPVPDPQRQSSHPRPPSPSPSTFPDISRRRHLSASAQPARRLGPPCLLPSVCPRRPDLGGSCPDWFRFVQTKDLIPFTHCFPPLRSLSSTAPPPQVPAAHGTWHPPLWSSSTASSDSSSSSSSSSSTALPAAARTSNSTLNHLHLCSATGRRRSHRIASPPSPPRRRDASGQSEAPALPVFCRSLLACACIVDSAITTTITARDPVFATWTVHRVSGSRTSPSFA